MKIVLIGSTGFVGQNLVDQLEEKVELIKTARNPINSSYIYFDFSNPSSWNNITSLKPDIIINAAAYGVVKSEVDINNMYEINYFQPVRFFESLLKLDLKFKWLQIGTAFEYDLSKEGGIVESDPCIPLTHYGISKLLFSNYLLKTSTKGGFSIFRPFGMFGRYENDSKFFPMLIKAQKENKVIKLSNGLQERDYFFVNDLAIFISDIIVNNRFNKLPAILNLGSGKHHSFKYYSKFINVHIPNYKKDLWKWGALPIREGESILFFNKSKKAFKLGFKITPYKLAFFETVKYFYFNGSKK